MSGVVVMDGQNSGKFFFLALRAKDGFSYLRIL